MISGVGLRFQLSGSLFHNQHLCLDTQELRSPKKLGIKDGFRVALLHLPDDVTSELRAELAKCRTQKVAEADKNLDFVFLFAKSRADLEHEFLPAAEALAPAGMLWVSWPKKSSGVPTDLTEDVIRQTGLSAGLVDVKVCAVTETWSGLKFVIPLKNRPKGETLAT